MTLPEGHFFVIFLFFVANFGVEDAPTTSLTWQAPMIGAAILDFDLTFFDTGFLNLKFGKNWGSSYDQTTERRQGRHGHGKPWLVRQPPFREQSAHAFPPKIGAPYGF